MTLGVSLLVRGPIPRSNDWLVSGSMPSGLKCWSEPFMQVAFQFWNQTAVVFQGITDPCSTAMLQPFFMCPSWISD